MLALKGIGSVGGVSFRVCGGSAGCFGAVCGFFIAGGITASDDSPGVTGP